MKHSGLQLQVLALYKKALSAAMHKDQDTLRFVRQRFREDVRSASLAQCPLPFLKCFYL
jgi:hypothetical protein